MGGLIVHYIPSFLVIALPPSADAYAFIADVELYPAQFYALAVSIGLLWLRSKRPELGRPFRAWLSVVWIRIIICIALIAAPFFPPKDGQGDVSLFYATYAIVGSSIIVLAMLYWYIGFVVLPRWRGYRIEEDTEVLPDGTSISKLVRVNDN